MAAPDRVTARQGKAMKNPRQLPAGGSPSVLSLSGSEVTLSANVQEHSALIAELVGGIRLRAGRTRRRRHRTCHLLVEEERTDFSRERQVLDRSPAGDRTDHRGIEVRIAGEVATESATRYRGCKGGTVVRSRCTIVANLGIAAPEAGRPVGIPVVVERTTNAPSVGKLDLTTRDVYTVTGVTKAQALIGSWTAGTTEHRKARGSAARGDH